MRLTSTNTGCCSLLSLYISPDRAVLNEANLKDAVLQRAVFTRSDLGGANIEGADFTNALLDKLQQQVRAEGLQHQYRAWRRDDTLLGCGCESHQAASL